MHSAQGKTKVGLVAESELNARVLTSLLLEENFDLGLHIKPAELCGYFEGINNSTAADNSEASEVDVWLLDIEEQKAAQCLEQLLEHTDAPLLLNEIIPPAVDEQAHSTWRQRLIEKLQLSAIPDNQEETQNARHRVENVVVLAASYGGPDAVQRFLARLPAKLPVAFVYGQHIESNFDQFLSKGVAKDHNYRVRILEGRSRLVTGDVAIVPPTHVTRFLPAGDVVKTEQSWEGSYAPSLDQMIAELARLYKNRLTVIVFTGMCNDGEVGCRVAAASGSTIWIQSPESCMSADMPEAVQSVGCVSYQGTPEQLADKLAAKYVKERTLQGALQQCNSRREEPLGM